MGKNKLKHFAENATFTVLVQPTPEEVKDSFYLKGKWASHFFRNDHPIVLELGCGKGEYTVALAKKYPNINFIGIDRKGARLWRGAKTTMEEKMVNAGFLRTRIEFLNYVFGKDEVNEIWITFPDPLPKNSYSNRRLTSMYFLNMYKEFLVPGGIIHLKTDNEGLYGFTKNLIRNDHFEMIYDLEDLYGTGGVSEATDIQTYYETRYLNEGTKIKYVSFRLKNSNHETNRGNFILSESV